MSKNKIRVVYIISDISKALEFEWVAEFIDRRKFDLHFILINPEITFLQNFLESHGFPVHYIPLPKSKTGLIKVSIKIFNILKNVKPDVVHTHLFVANLTGLTAAWLKGVPRRIYTRHHSNFHHVYFLNGLKYDKYCNRIATDIISISPVTSMVLIKMEHVKEEKVHEIPHGFDLQKFKNPDHEMVIKLRKEYNPQNKKPVIGIIARYTELKGIQYVIPAFEEFLKRFPDALLILANAHGDYKNSIQALLKQLPEESYREIIFEENLYCLYQLFDFFIHVPVDKDSEAFGQTYVEPLAAGIPGIFTLSGIAGFFIKDRVNARVVPFKNSNAILSAMNDTADNHVLNQQLISQGLQDVQVFKIGNMISALEKLYSESVQKKNNI